MDGAAAAAQAADGGLQARRAELVVLLPISACLAAGTAPVTTAAVVGSMLAGMITLPVGVWLFMEGRGHRRIRFVNVCISFLALVVAVGQGGHFFDTGLLFMIYNALAA